jgi:hypothetical protein
MERIVDSHWLWAVIIDCNCKEVPINPLQNPLLFFTQTPNTWQYIGLSLCIITWLDGVVINANMSLPYWSKHKDIHATHYVLGDCDKKQLRCASFGRELTGTVTAHFSHSVVPPWPCVHPSTYLPTIRCYIVSYWMSLNNPPRKNTNMEAVRSHESE